MSTPSLAVNADLTVGELAARNPFFVHILEDAGIDYHLGGSRPLQEACARAHISIDRILSLFQIESRRDREVRVDWLTAPMHALIDHIVQGHHAFTRVLCQRIKENIERSRVVHATKASLKLLDERFERFATGLLHHLDQEELVVFKMIDGLARHVSLDSPFFSIEAPEKLIRFMHESQEDGLGDLRSLTEGYTAPPGACAALRGVVADLKALERDLHEHLHLENNVLFPRAVELERELR